MLTMATIKNCRGMSKELKNSECIKCLWETSSNINIGLDGGTAVIKVFQQRDLEIAFF